jgi:hypothetical protein
MAARLSALRACRTLPPGFFIFKDSWYSFLLEAESTPGQCRGAEHHRQRRRGEGKGKVREEGRVDNIPEYISISGCIATDWADEAVTLQSRIQVVLRSNLGRGIDYRDICPQSLEAIFFSTPKLPGLFWGPPSLVINGYREIFPPGVTAAGAWSWPLTSA